MSYLKSGVWHAKTFKPKDNDQGDFVREDSQFRDWIGSEAYPAEAGRYHLYVSYACPWAHRTLIFRRIKGLTDMIGVSVVHPYMGEHGWEFRDYPGATPDPVNGFRYLHQAYTLAQADYSGIVSVPVLWDKKTHRIVNNESAEIIRMFNSAFDAVGAVPGDYYPELLRPEIDRVNHRIYETVNNGVYRAGFAQSQRAYEKAFDALFDTLDWLERRLAGQRYLVGDALTEADWRLLTTLLRFDSVYHLHFKCNQRRLVDYPHLWAYTRDLYQTPGVADTLNLDHIKHHYYTSHPSINPTGIIPKGPVLDFDAPHGRG